MANKKEQTRRFRYAVGYVIQQEGSGVVERLVRDGTMAKFGVREDQFLSSSLEELNRTDAEKILRKKEWRFQNYDKIEIGAVTVPAKIFDTQILFSAERAISLAQKALQDLQFESVEESGRLDPITRDRIAKATPKNFFENYITRLELFVQDEYGQNQPILRRIRNLPYKNVETSTTTI